MKLFMISDKLPGLVIAVDVSDISGAQTAPFHEFRAWKECEKHFLELGAPPETLHAVADALKKTGAAVLTF